MHRSGFPSIPPSCRGLDLMVLPDDTLYRLHCAACRDCQAREGLEAAFDLWFRSLLCRASLPSDVAHLLRALIACEAARLA